MRFYRYWAKETARVEGEIGAHAVAVWRWSDVSLEEARAHAREAIAEVVQRFRSGQPLNRYSYLDRPLREEIVEEIAGGDGGVRTVLTRNSYGSLVLNSERVMFIDVDGDEGGVGASFKRLFSLFSKSKQPEADPGLERVREAAARHPDTTFRVYRTFKGFRCLVTSETFDPAGAKARTLLEDFGSDPLYVKLCEVQHCFRARLSPKHWRLGVPKPPARYPFVEQGAEPAYRGWLRDYETAIARHAACTYVETLGPGRSDFDVEPTVKLHDRHACGAPDTPLA